VMMHPHHARRPESRLRRRTPVTVFRARACRGKIPVRLFKGIIGDGISQIAVGTLITERPPHRAERAPFGHSAPTSGI
jgi:hypothetical protein